MDDKTESNSSALDAVIDIKITDLLLTSYIWCWCVAPAPSAVTPIAKRATAVAV